MARQSAALRWLVLLALGATTCTGYESDAIVVKNDAQWKAVAAQIKNGLTEIRGQLEISGTKGVKGSEVSAVLSTVTRVIGSVRIEGNAHAEFHLGGLGKLSKIHGSLTIQNNAGLSDLDGFASLRQVDGSIEIKSNPGMKSVAGFQAMDVLGYGLVITGNDKLTTMSGFARLSTFFFDGFVQVESNPALVSFEGINGVEEIQKGISFKNNGIILLNGFQALATMGASYTVVGNPKLTEMVVPPKLASVDGDVVISGNGALASTKLSITGPPSLASVSGTVAITNNAGIVALTGFNFAASAAFTLKAIDVSGNTRSSFDVGGFNGLRACPSIKVNDNGGAGRVDVTGFNGLSTADSISVSGNDGLAELSGFAFASGGVAKEVLITGNAGFGAGSISVSGFTGMNTVSEAVMITGNTRLTAVDGFAFGGSASIKAIVISGNTASALDVGGFTGLNTVSEVVNITHNSRVIAVSGFKFPAAGNVNQVNVVGNTGSAESSMAFSGFQVAGVVNVGDVIFADNTVVGLVDGFNFASTGAVGAVTFARNSNDAGALTLSGFRFAGGGTAKDLAVDRNTALALTVSGFAKTANADKILFQRNTATGTLAVPGFSGAVGKHILFTDNAAATLSVAGFSGNVGTEIVFRANTATGDIDVSGFKGTVGTQVLFRNNSAAAGLAVSGFAGGVGAQVVVDGNKAANLDVSGFAGPVRNHVEFSGNTASETMAVSGFATGTVGTYVLFTGNDAGTSMAVQGFKGAVGTQVLFTGNTARTSMAVSGFAGAVGDAITVSNNTAGAAMDIAGFSGLGAVKRTVVSGNRAAEMTVSGFTEIGAVDAVQFTENKGGRVDVSGFTGTSAATDAVLNITGNQGNASITISGFNGIGVASRVTIAGNQAADISITGVSGLTSGGAVQITDNQGLATLGGFEFADGALVAGIVVSGNTHHNGSLVVSGFNGFANATDTIAIRGNQGLASVSGFSATSGQGGRGAALKEVIIANNSGGGIAVSGFNGFADVAVGVAIVNNQGLAAVSGFRAAPGATIQGGVVISSNTGTIALTGFRNIAHFRGEVTVAGNSGLEDVSGFVLTGSGSSMKAIVIAGNTGAALSITGFRGLGTIGPTTDVNNTQHHVHITSNSGVAAIGGFQFPGPAAAVTGVVVTGNSGAAGTRYDLSGFTGLASASNIIVSTNTQLGSISGFAFESGSVGRLVINGHRDLVNISGFAGLRLCTHSATVVSNPLLRAITGFPSLTGAPVLTIADNKKLSSLCGMQSLVFESLTYADNSANTTEPIAVPMNLIGLALRPHVDTFALTCAAAAAVAVAGTGTPATQGPATLPVTAPSTPSTAAASTAAALATSAAGEPRFGPVPGCLNTTANITATAGVDISAGCECDDPILGDGGAVVFIVLFVVQLVVVVALVAVVFRLRNNQRVLSAPMETQTTEAAVSKAAVSGALY